MNNPFQILQEQLNRIENRLGDIDTVLHRTITAPLVQPDILNIREAAELLGYEVSSCYGLVHRRAIPHSKRGKKLFFSRKKLLEWVSDAQRGTLVEQEQKANDYLVKKK